jgi:hypothetical protein
MFENRVLRRILGPRRDVVTGEWWNLHNEELNKNLFLTNNENHNLDNRQRNNLYLPQAN